MTAETTQDTGTDTTDAGGTQTADTSTQTAAGTETTATQGAAEGAKEGEGKPAPAGVEYKFDAPEGVELDAKQIDAFKALAKENNLSADAAKKIADIAVQAEVARREAFADQVKAWGDELAADKELGNAENQAAMRAVVDRFGTPEFKTLLNSTGMGNHPQLARFVFNVSKAMSEDKVHGKAAGDASTADTASMLYPTHNAKA